MNTHLSKMEFLPLKLLQFSCIHEKDGFGYSKDLAELKTVWECPD